MAISWGSWDYGNSSAGFRVGLDVTRTSVSHSSSSVTYTVKVYVEAMYNVNDAMTVSCSGSISGSDEQNLTTGSSGGVKHWFTKTYTYNYSTYGSSPGTRTFRADLSGVYNGANPYRSLTYTLPARPYAAPAAPSGVAAVRNSDSQATVSWTRHPTAGEPYSSLLVQKRELNGSTWGAWANVGYTSATANSLVVAGLSTNRAYEFRVRSNNSVGSSAFVQAANPVYMTPGAPSGVTSALDANGSTVTTTWAENAYDSATVTYTIQRSVNGAAYANVATGLAAGVLTWTDPTPGGGSNRYRVAAVQSVGSLSSAYAEGNTVSTIVAPLAPTQLSPNGGTVDLGNAVALTWKHNHGGDGAAQSRYSVRVSSDGGVTWTAYTAADVASSAASHTIPAGTLANGGTYLWQVQTKGIDSAGYGPWSTSGTFVGSSTPTATPSSPPATVTTLPVLVEWAYNQDEASPQTAWEVQIVKDSDGAVVNSSSGSDAATTTEFSGSKLTDGEAYTARVRVRSGAGLWSAWADVPFVVDLLSPAPVTTTAAYDPETGTVVLSLQPEPAGVDTVPVESMTVERQVDGGGWVTLVEGLTGPTDLLDVIPLSSGLNTYRVTSVSSTPTYHVNPDVQVDADPQGWVFVNYGADFTDLLRFRTEPRISESGGREQALVPLLGREEPVALYGEGTSRAVSVSGVVLFDGGYLDSPPSDWIEAGQVAATVCFRDFTGRRLFGALSGVSASDTAPGEGTVSFTVTESDYTEPGGVVDESTDPTTATVVDGGTPYRTGSIIFDGGSP